MSNDGHPVPTSQVSRVPIINIPLSTNNEEHGFFNTIRAVFFADDAGADEENHGGPDGSRNEVEAAKRAETDRVLNLINSEVIASLNSESYMNHSCEDTNEYWLCIPVAYSSPVATMIEQELYNLYSKERSHAHPHLPYCTAHMRYNILTAVSNQPKPVYITMFFFRFVQNPRPVLASLDRSRLI